MASWGRPEISKTDETLVRRKMAERYAKMKSTDMSLDEFITRKIEEFKDRAEMGGALWEEHFKLEWLNEGLEQMPNTGNQEDVIRFL